MRAALATLLSVLLVAGPAAASRQLARAVSETRVRGSACPVVVLVPVRVVATRDAASGKTRFAYEVASESSLWDKDNRLRSVTAPSGVSSFDYDARGIRTKKNEAGVETRYLLDGASVLEEFDGAGAVKSTFLNNPQAIDDVLAMNIGGQLVFPLADALGSVYGLTDSSGAVVRRQDFDVYGERTGSTGAGPATDRGYTSREHDAWGGIFNRDRERNPKLGSWLQADRLGMIDGPNLYSYADGNPVMNTDPTGESVYVLFWGPNAGENNFGHAVLAVNSGPSLRLFGLWPTNRWRVGMGLESTSRGEPQAWLDPSQIESYRSDEGRPADAIVEIVTAGWEDQAVMSAAAANQMGSYALQTNNCATYVATSLRPLGFDAAQALESFPHKAPTYSSPMTTTTPRRLFKVLTVKSYAALDLPFFHNVSVLREPNGRLGGLLPFEVY